MPIETEPNPHRIETGRSWRDLPPAPPTDAPLRPQTPAPPPTAEVGRSLPWARIAAGIVALAVGISVGVWAPWARSQEDASESLASEELPETIVPDPPPELQQDPPLDDPFVIPPDSPDAPQDFFDQLPEDFFDQIPEEFRDQLPDGFFDGLPGATVGPAGLIDLADLPDGYQVRSNVFSESSDRASQRVRLLGPSGAVDVQAISGPDVSLPTAGDAFDVAGTEGRLAQTGDATTLSWLADDGLLVTVEAGTDVDLDLLTAVAEAVEVLE